MIFLAIFRTHGSNRGRLMRLAVPKETRAGETRVAATPESVKKLKTLGLDVVVQAGAGAGAPSPMPIMRRRRDHRARCRRRAADADIVLKVRGPGGVKPPR